MKCSICILIISYFLKSNSAFSNDYVPDLSSQAFQNSWLALVHYSSKGKGYISSIINKDFFLSSDGKTNPLAELRATVETLNREPEKQCDFLARAYYLKKLHLLEKEESCAEYLDWKEEYGPGNVEVNFATQYISSAPSTFGHLFVTVQSEVQPRTLHMTFNFSGEITNGNPFAFVWNGLFGGFRASFQLLPMSQRLNAYNKIENRGIWSYTIDFTDDEKEYAYRYLWENLKYGQKKYYFTVQNCASEILHLVTTIKGIEYNEKIFYLSPLEVIRYIGERKLFTKFILDPSQDSVLSGKIQLLEDQEKNVIKKIVEEKDFSSTSNLSPRELDVLIEYYQYYKIKNNGVLSMAMEKYWAELLSARAKTKTIVPESENITLPPHLIHKPQRINYSILKNNHFSALGISYRPTFHSRIDPVLGFESNSDVELFTTAFQVQRGEDHSGRLKLERVEIVNVNNFVPISLLEIRPSWGVTLAYRDQTIDKDFNNNKFIRTEGRIGFNFIKNNKWDWILYGKMFYDVGRLKDTHHFNVGPQSILMYYLRNSKINWDASVVYNPIKFKSESSKLFFESQLAYSMILKNNSQIGLELSSRKSMQKAKTEINQLTFNQSFYF